MSDNPAEPGLLPDVISGCTYRITPIQQPDIGAAFRANPLSRLPLSPCLILQMDTWDQSNSLIIPYEDLPFLVCHLTLQTQAGDDASGVRNPQTREIEANIYGTLVATPTEMDNQEGHPGIYFVFPDISVRYPGSYRLKAFIMRITGVSGTALDDCYTSAFPVVEQSVYVAPPVTELTQHFASQRVANFGLPQGDWLAGNWAGP